jgi:diguanylate cyclase (GGDEF)-like protein
MPAMIGVSLALGAFNLAAIRSRRRSPRFIRIFVPVSLAVDFLACTALVMLTANDRFGTGYVVYALVAIEAAVLYRIRGTVFFIAGFAAALTAYYVERGVFLGIPVQSSSVLFRSAVILLIAFMSGGITRSAEASANEARRQTRRAEALAVVATRLAQTLKREYVVGTVMDELQRLFPERWHGLLNFAGDGQLVLAEIRGVPETLSLSYPRNPVPDDETHMVIDDIWADGRDQAASDRTPDALADYRSAVFLAIGTAKNRHGLLLSFDRNPGAFSPDEVRFMTALAGQVSTGLDNARLYEEVETLSLTDQTTALSNRRALDARLEEEFLRAERYGQPLAVMMIDVDHFKAYNDREGHLAGDAALRRLGAVLGQKALRQVDLAFRYGGEEFSVLMPLTNLRVAARVAGRLRDIIRAEAFAGGTGQPLGRLTVSVGVAAFPEHGTSAMELLACADHALYEAKRLGRDRVVAHSATAA